MYSKKVILVLKSQAIENNYYFIRNSGGCKTSLTSDYKLFMYKIQK